MLLLRYSTCFIYNGMIGSIHQSLLPASIGSYVIQICTEIEIIQAVAKVLVWQT